MSEIVEFYSGRMKDIQRRSIEDIWALEESRERLTILTVADEAKASGWRDLASNTTHVAA